MNYAYILRCADGTLYCGWTNNLEERLKKHNSGLGSKYTRSRLPVELAYYESFESKEAAIKIAAEKRAEYLASKYNI